MGEMLPFGGHHHGSSWINESVRVGLSESVSIMSLCIAGQDYRQQGRTGRRKRAEWRSQKVWAVLGRKYYDWRGMKNVLSSRQTHICSQGCACVGVYWEMDDALNTDCSSSVILTLSRSETPSMMLIENSAILGDRSFPFLLSPS